MIELTIAVIQHYKPTTHLLICSVSLKTCRNFETYIFFFQSNIIGSPAYFIQKNRKVFYYSMYFTLVTYNWQFLQQHINLNINNQIHCQNVFLTEDKLSTVLQVTVYSKF